jgi:hypothetical protein
LAALGAARIYVAVLDVILVEAIALLLIHCEIFFW